MRRSGPTLTRGRRLRLHTSRLLSPRRYARAGARRNRVTANGRRGRRPRPREWRRRRSRTPTKTTSPWGERAEERGERGTKARPGRSSDIRSGPNGPCLGMQAGAFDITPALWREGHSGMLSRRVRPLSLALLLLPRSPPPPPPSFSRRSAGVGELCPQSGLSNRQYLSTRLRPVPQSGISELAG